MAYRSLACLAFSALTSCINPLAAPFPSQPPPGITSGEASVLGKIEEVGFPATPLTPRKNYDLLEELRIFKACKATHQCVITGDPTMQTRLILAAKPSELFIWVIRASGHLVIGSGPDKMITHGLLASVDLADTDQARSPMGSVYAAGEGYYESPSNTLYLNNKSGHYRPEFARVTDPTVTKMFQSRLPRSVIFKFIDETKPRITEIY